MSKPIARKDDHHKCSNDGHDGGKIQTGSHNAFVNGQPIARVGDKVTCKDGSEHSIKSSQSCLIVNGKLAARVGDATGHDGEISSGASKVFVANCRPFIEIGDFGCIDFGDNVFFGDHEEAHTEPQIPFRYTSHEDKYTYYLVTAEGLKEKLTTFMWEDLTPSIDLTDYFEESRWVASKPNAGEQAEERIELAKEQYNRQQIRDQGRANWKGRERFKRPSNIVSKPLNSTLESRVTVAEGILGAAAAGENHLDNTSIIRLELIANLKLKQAEIKCKMPQNGGVVLEAQYQIAPTENGEAIEFHHLHTLEAGEDYTSIIKKAMTEPFLIEQPLNAMHHWEFLFILATKE